MHEPITPSWGVAAHLVIRACVDQSADFVLALHAHVRSTCTRTLALTDDGGRHRFYGRRVGQPCSGPAMTTRFATMLIQFGPAMDDLSANVRAIRSARRDAAAAGVDLVVSPQLGLAGHPPADMAFDPTFLERVRALVQSFAAETGDGGPAMLLGVPWQDGADLHDAAVLLGRGGVIGWRARHVVPDRERSVFAPGPMPGPMALPLPDGSAIRLGVMIGEDMGGPDVAEALAETGAEILVCLDASPFTRDMHDLRLGEAVARVTETGLPFVMVNAAGGQNETVAYGMSFVLGADRRLAMLAPAFESTQAVTVWQRDDDRGWLCAQGVRTPPLPEPEAVYRALMLGLRDHAERDGFPAVIAPMTGDVASATCAAIAVDALGGERVRGVLALADDLPAEAADRARRCASSLGIRLDEVALTPGVAALGKTLAPLLGNPIGGRAQTRLHAGAIDALVAAMADATGGLRLATGTKSDRLLGRGTTTGDFAPVRDLYASEVTALAEWRNGHRPRRAAGPEGVVVPLPAALEPDADIDVLLESLVARGRTPDELVAEGHTSEAIARILDLIARAEAARRPAIPGIVLSAKPFESGRRHPISHAWRRHSRDV
ncbi:nitrilase-related carbon-nitrogen hydrolase [Marinivivus vitaminiproducens]|uniref:nitrilase-related carbon-nitrogen hydrolase n=1 Tax=Marinivivus vitaminiproducens TaxID=3035935 RepID=UPI00279AF8CD|nr:nitrilase-related carbon-nitrogen hydrolase [Geminicoccaceae bacterium SCSIO 64248]